MKLDQNPFGALRAKSRSLRRKGDITRISASTTVACDGTTLSPKQTHFRRSHEDLAAANSSRTSSTDSYGLQHHSHLHPHDYSTSSPVLLGGDKELHDPNFVRHNWEMMSGESALRDNQLHIGRSVSPRLHSRRSTLSSRTGSSRPSSRSGSETGGHQTPTFGLGVSAFSGLSSYSQAGSIGRASGARSTSNRGLQVEGSILRDEEAILDSDDDSTDEEDSEKYANFYSSYRLPGSASNSRPVSRRNSSARNSPPSLLPPPLSTTLQAAEPQSNGCCPPSPSHLDTDPAAAAFHRRRHWTVAEGSQASNAAGMHVMAGQIARGPASTMKERSLSQPA